MNLWLLVGNENHAKKNNDACITKHILGRNEEGIKNWIQSEDVAIVDRGFRDATEFLKMHGLQVEMPSY
jgi:hypothetical protein